jgi:hypothetical protein
MNGDKAGVLPKNNAVHLLSYSVYGMAKRLVKAATPLGRLRWEVMADG